MFTIEMLPAAEGDCLWIEYGDDRQAPNRVLIDSGTPSTYKTLEQRIELLPEGQRHFELFIVTHIDSDHIGAAPRLLDKRPFDVTFGDVWFNGWRHLPKALDKLGERQAGLLSDALESPGVPWNAAFSGNAVMVPAAGQLPVRMLPGGLKLTLLSPYEDQLAALVPGWKKYLEEVKRGQPAKAEARAEDSLGQGINVEALWQRDFEEDDKGPNGSSIAVLAEYGRHQVLLGADAFPSVIERSLGLLLAEGERLKIDAFKVCHHGSTRNTSNDLAKRIDAASWLVSTSGSRHGHPDPESIARLLMNRPCGWDKTRTRILFNYESSFTEPWKNSLLQANYCYLAVYARPGEGIKWTAEETT